MPLSAESMLRLSQSSVEGAASFLARGKLNGAQQRLCDAVRYLVASSLRVTSNPAEARVFLRHRLPDVLENLHTLRLQNPTAPWCDTSAVMDVLEASVLMGRTSLTELVAEHVATSLREKFAGEYARGILELLQGRAFVPVVLPPLRTRAEQRIRETYLEPYLGLTAKLSSNNDTREELAEIRRLFAERNVDPDWKDLHLYYGTIEDPVNWDLAESCILAAAEVRRL